MKLTLKRIALKPSYTIGHLYIDGKYFCDTIEDKVRDLKKEPKVKGQTAIPYGTYEVITNVVSPRFKDRSWAKPYGGKVPRLVNVPGFEGVLIHPGTDQNSTSGCLIIGQNKIKGKVINSQKTFYALMSKLKDQKNITITIE